MRWLPARGDDPAGEVFADAGDVIYRIQPANGGWEAVAEKNGRASLLITGVSRNRAYYAATHFHHWDKIPEAVESKTHSGAERTPSSDGMRITNSSSTVSFPASPSEHIAQPFPASASAKPEDTVSDQAFYPRLNLLFDRSRGSNGRPLSSEEAAAKLSQSGFLMTVNRLNQLRSGTGPPPTVEAITALARLFGVPMTFLAPVGDSSPPGPLSAPAEGGKHRARSDVDGHPGHISLDPSHVPDIQKVLADRLNELFETREKRTGMPLTSAELAATLQQDGFAVSGSLIGRLRAASGDQPNPQTLEALAYFFDVDTEYLISRPQPMAANHPAHAAEGAAINAGVHDVACDTKPPAVFETSRLQIISIATMDLGRIVSVLAQEASQCVSNVPADRERTARLLVLLDDLGALLSTPRESPVVSRPLLRQIVTELKAARRTTLSHQSLLTRMNTLLDER